MIDTAAFQGKKAAYYTLGCKLNFSETSTFGKMLQEMGVVTAAKGEKAVAMPDGDTLYLSASSFNIAFSSGYFSSFPMNTPSKKPYWNGDHA